MDITNIVSLIVEILVALFVMRIVPIIKANMDSKDALVWIDIAVRAAEQIYAQNEGEKKKAYVIKYLLERGITLNSNDLEVAVEAAVLKLHRALEDA